MRRDGEEFIMADVCPVQRSNIESNLCLFVAPFLGTTLSTYCTSFVKNK